jgi:hypothetical protein
MTSISPGAGRRHSHSAAAAGRERLPSTFNWEFSPKGQHIELGIAEMNPFILLSALGLSHSINGVHLARRSTRARRAQCRATAAVPGTSRARIDAAPVLAGCRHVAAHALLVVWHQLCGK